MGTSKLDRLLFAQGGKCFFCNAMLKPGDASVEHLAEVCKDGSTHDENCVACYRALN